MEKGARYTGQEFLPFFLLLSLYCCCLENGKGRGKGRCANSSHSFPAQAPVLLTCKEILKQHIQSLLVNALLSLTLQPLEGWDLTES